MFTHDVFFSFIGGAGGQTLPEHVLVVELLGMLPLLTAAGALIGGFTLVGQDDDDSASGEMELVSLFGAMPGLSVSAASVGAFSLVGQDDDNGLSGGTDVALSLAGQGASDSLAGETDLVDVEGDLVTISLSGELSDG